MNEREIDQELVERAQAGDKQAFERLVEKYQRKLGRLLSRFIRDHAEVEDVAQEAFVIYYKRLRTGEAGRAATALRLAVPSVAAEG